MPDKINLKDKNIVLFHDSDLDGVSSWVLAEYIIDDICNLFPIQIRSGEVDKEINWELLKNCDYIVFTDCAPTANLYRKFIRKKIHNKVIIFDHHITSWEDLKQYNIKNYFYTDTQCATKIFYEWLMDNFPKFKSNETLTEWVRLVNIYDMFETSNVDFKKARGLHYCRMKYNNKENGYRLSFERKFNKKNLNYSEPEQKWITRNFEHEEEMLKTALKKGEERIDNKGLKYFYTELPYKISIVSNLILIDNPDYNYILIFNTYIMDEQKFSLRSMGYDVRKIAEKYSGGGHVRAAGLVITDNDLFKNIRKGVSHLQ